MSVYLFISSGCLLLSFLLGLLFTCLARRNAVRLGLMDRPKSEGHKNHQIATPVAGGMAIWLAIASTGLVALIVLLHLPHLHLHILLTGVLSVKRLWLCIGCCATALMVMGLCDDHTPMSARTKLLFQLAAAVITAAFCPRLLVGFCPSAVAFLLTVLWITAVINAMNFFDNMDGLSGGTGSIALVFLSVVSFLNGQYFVTAFNCTALGAMLGFLAFNRPPATIFMGDSGSHLLGYLLATASILTSYYHAEACPTLAPVLTPVIILAIPLLDAITVVIIRLYLHKPIYVGDNRHLSHRFVQLGMTRPQAVYAIWLLSFIAGAGALALRYLPPFGAALVIAQILALMALILLIQFCARSSTP